MKYPSYFLIILPLVTTVACSLLQPQRNEGHTVAKVNNEIISESQLRGRMNPRGLSEAPQGDAQNAGLKDKDQALHELIDEEVIIQQAIKEGVLAKSERLRREVTREYFQVKLAGGKEQATEEQVKAFFEAQKANYERVRARHILITPKKKNDAASDLAAQKKAESVLAELKTQGRQADFAVFVKKYSDDATTKNTGGDLSYIEQTKVVPAFWDAVTKLQGDRALSEVVKTEFGYHIIQLTEDKRGLEANRGTVQLQLAKANKIKLMDDLMKNLRDKASVKIDQAFVAKVNPLEPSSVTK